MYTLHRKITEEHFLVRQKHFHNAAKRFSATGTGFTMNSRDLKRFLASTVNVPGDNRSIHKLLAFL